MSSSVVEALRAAVDPDRVTERLVEMVQIPSVNPYWQGEDTEIGEGSLAEYLGGRLADLGCAVETDEVESGRPNVWTRIGDASGPSIALVGHLDTVGVIGYDEPFSGAIGGGRVHGRGSCDMKAGIAAFLEVAAVIRETGVDLPGEVVIAGIIDEEIAMIGSKKMGLSPLADCAIIGEPTSLQICTSHLGEVGMFITTKGKAVHASIPETGVNAVEKMGSVLSALAEYRAELFTRAPHPLCGHGRLNPAVISGGDMAAIVPDRCDLEIDRRTIPGETPESVVSDVHRYLEAIAAEDPEFEYEVGDLTWDIGTLDTPATSPVVMAAQQAAEWAGSSSELGAFSAATDGPNLGLPAVVWGPGSIAQAHTIDEFVGIDETIMAAHLYLGAVFGYLEGAA